LSFFYLFIKKLFFLSQGVAVGLFYILPAARNTYFCVSRHSELVSESPLIQGIAGQARNDICSFFHPTPDPSPKGRACRVFVNFY